MDSYTIINTAPTAAALTIWSIGGVYPMLSCNYLTIVGSPIEITAGTNWSSKPFADWSAYCGGSIVLYPKYTFANALNGVLTISSDAPVGEYSFIYYYI